MAHVTAAPSRERGDAYGSTGVQPLPQRVRQASLAAELRVPADEAGHGGHETRGTDGPPSRSGAVVGAFQRESRRARKADSALRPGLDGLPEVGSATREDRE